MKTENTPTGQIESLMTEQREFFKTGKTLDIAFRREKLKALGQALKEWEKPLLGALMKDLHKSEEESILTELSIVSGEVRNHQKHLKSWSKPDKRPTPLKMMPSKCWITYEPLGCSLIIAPWNYPVQLLLNPLVGSISAGCTAILKPSPYVPHVSDVIGRMIKDTFDENYIGVVQGDRTVNKVLLTHKFDIIFFTGSPSLGKTVMKAAAEHLTPVVLELGGKSPCIVDRTADMDLAARRIAWGKTLNAGQTCIAPDYLLIHTSLLNRFIEAFRKEIRCLHGDDPRNSKHYVRLVNERAFDRVSGYLTNGHIATGGHTVRDELYIEPTLLTDVDPLSPIMQEEIFGPVLPILTYERITEVVDFINSRQKPLALYYFGDSKTGKEVIRMTSAGGSCINDTIMHIANEHLPFGGVGNSGMGHYHGYESFKAFSHQRSVVDTPTWIDLPFRYMPYNMFKWVKRIL